MTNAIAQSVGDWGKGAVNMNQDVETVQKILETAAVVRHRTDFDPKGVDGKIAKPPRVSSTVKAIIAFQSTFLTNPDGLIEPGKNSLAKLNQVAALQEKNVAPPPFKSSRPGRCFPLSNIPNQSYKTGGRRFGARRSKGTRKHAGCDLIVPEGTKIYAVDTGKIVRGPYHFYRGTYAIEVEHPNFLVRYCEIKKTAKGVRQGGSIASGQHIAFVGKMFFSSMLHLELYENTVSGRLTQRSNPPYQRRSDLLDPTPYLDIWSRSLPI